MFAAFFCLVAGKTRSRAAEAKSDYKAPGIQTASEEGIHRLRMGLRGFGWSSNITCHLDLLRRHLRLSAWIFLGLDSRSHFRVVGCCGDDLFVAARGVDTSLFDLSRIWHSPGTAGLHCRLRCRSRHRNDLVVAYGSGRQAALKLEKIEPQRALPAVACRT